MSDRHKFEYPVPPAELTGGVSFRLFKYFGAGAIIASVTIGSGETLFASRAGALFGYSLIWCFVAGAVMKCVQVYTAARYITLTGEHPMAHWGHLPGPRNWVPWTIGLLSLACFPFWLAGLPMMIGQTINWIVGLDVAIKDQARLLTLAKVWATITILIAVSLNLVQSYRVLERVQQVIVGLLLASLLAACFAVRPDWLAALAGLIPTAPEYPDWVRVDFPKIEAEWIMIAVCLGAIGGGTYDYIGYVGCLREKAWGAIGRFKATVTPGETLPLSTTDENVRRSRGWLRAAKIDVGVGFLCVLVFTGCFIVLGAVILHKDHAVPTKFALLSKQSLFLTQFHPALLYFYQLGIFMAFFGTIYGAYEIYYRTTYECLAPLTAKVRDMEPRKLKRWVLAYCAFAALPVLWFGGDDAMKLVAPAAIVGGVLTCGLWCFAMLWTEKRFLPRALRMHPGLAVANWISGIVLTGLGIHAIWLAVAAFLKPAAGG